MAPILKKILGQYGGALDVAGFVSEDDGFQHAIVATENGAIRELFFFGGGETYGSDLTNIPGVIAVGAFYSSDDRYRHVVVATRAGDIIEVFYHPTYGLGSSVLANIPGVVDLDGFYTADDRMRHVLVATEAGDIFEIYFNPERGINTVKIGTIPGALSVGGFCSDDDNYRHAIVAARDGVIREVFYYPATGIGQADLGNIGGSVSAAGFYSSDDKFRHAIIGSVDGNITELFYSPISGKGQGVIAMVNGLKRIAGFFTPEIKDNRNLWDEFVDFLHARTGSPHRDAYLDILAVSHDGTVTHFYQDRMPNESPKTSDQGASASGTTPPLPRVDSYAITLYRQPVQSGPLPYASQVPAIGTLYGNLISISNPSTQQFRIGLVKQGKTTQECFSDPDAAVVLAPGQQATPEQVASVYGVQSPQFPIVVLACIEAAANAPGTIQVEMTYSH